VVRPARPGQGGPCDDPPSKAARDDDHVIENRTETRSPRSEGAPRRFLGVDPTVALVIGAALLVIIVVALVAMTKGSDDAPSRRSV
jgi:hypothetical protein